MIVSQPQIKAVTNEIQLILHKREESLNNAIKTFNSWKAVANFFKELLSSMCQAKKMILNDVNELKGIKAKYEILSQLRQIDINDPLSEKLTEIYIEMQGVLKNINRRPIDDLVEAIQINLNKIDHIVKQKLSINSEDGSMSAKNNQETMATYNSSVITRRTFSTNVNYRKDIDFKQDNVKDKFLSPKESYSPTYSQRMHDNMEFTNLVERQNDIGSSSRRSKFDINNMVDYKKGDYVELSFLNDVITGNEVNHLSTDCFSKLFDELSFKIHFTAVADQTSQAYTALFCIFKKTFTDIVCCIYRHHFSGTYDVNLLSFTIADRHCETTTNNVTKYIIEYIIKIGIVSSDCFHQVNRCDYPASCTSYTRFRTS